MAARKSKAWTIEHVFFPALRQRYMPPKSAAEDGTIVRVASLDKLYKVFERC
jgi:DNA mismatch repair protein MLH1